MSGTRVQRRRLLKAAGGVAVLVLIIVGVVVVTSGSGSTPSVTAMFANASPLEDGNLVKAQGVVVGRVASIKLVGGQSAVKLSLSKSVLPLHRDASATIEPISLLGERFVSLNPGTSSEPTLGSDAVISSAHTGSDVNLDQVLNTLDDPTSAALASLISSLGTGVDGQGANIANAVKALAPAMDNTSALTSILSQQNTTLDKLLDVADPAAQALAAGQGQELGQLVATAKQTLSTVAANREAMDATLDQLPQTLANAETTLGQLAGVANAATPVLTSIKPVTDNLTQITGELHEVANAANPALAKLPAVLTRLDTLLRQAKPVVDQLPSGASALAADTATAQPLGAQVLFHPSNREGTLDYLMEGVANWAMTTSSYDSLGNYFRGALLFSEAPGSALGVLGPSTTPISTPSPPAGGGPQGSATTSAKPAASTATPAASPQTTLNNMLNATGLTQTQESGLLGELLGGL